jgi:hypothetical protein
MRQIEHSVEKATLPQMKHHNGFSAEGHAIQTLDSQTKGVIFQHVEGSVHEAKSF